ncbi:hypothetical protein [Streptomyces sp. NPDC004232]|uniref:hypothetical protein n=1 Tax=unclassified Streptomyces TaxID=2593676 RepID=UPI0033B5C7A4
MPVVSDRSDPRIGHLPGLTLSRAAALRSATGAPPGRAGAQSADRGARSPSGGRPARRGTRRLRDRALAGHLRGAGPRSPG